MRHSLFIVSMLALSACATSQGTSPQETASPDAPNTTIPAELASFRPAYITAWSATDPSGLQVYFPADAVVVTPTGTYTTWSDISSRWIAPLLAEHYTITPVTFEKTGDHTYTETGTYSFVMNSNGSPMTMKGHYTYRWKKQADGSWQIASVDFK